LDVIEAYKKYVPVGAGMDFWGPAASLPAGWLLCYGQAVSRVTYAALFAVIGTTYGAGDGSTSFNVPDKKGRISAGLDNMGGAAAGRLSAYTTLGFTGGGQTVTLVEDNMAPHDHSVNDHDHSYTRYNELVTIQTGTGGTVTNLWRSTLTVNTSDENPATNDGSGSSTPVSIVQPTIACNYMIFAGV
jgi:microcystin-dependent protein